MGSIEVECFFEKLNSEPKQGRYELPANSDKRVGVVFVALENYRVLLTAFSPIANKPLKELAPLSSTLGQLYEKYGEYGLTAFDCIPIGLFDYFVYSF